MQQQQTRLSRALVVKSLIEKILPSLTKEKPEEVAALLERCMTDVCDQGVTLDADEETREMLLGAECSDAVGHAETEMPTAIQHANVDFQRVADSVRAAAQSKAQVKTAQSAQAKARWDAKPEGVTWTAAASWHDFAFFCSTIRFMLVLFTCSLHDFCSLVLFLGAVQWSPVPCMNAVDFLVVDIKQLQFTRCQFLHPLQQDQARKFNNFCHWATSQRGWLRAGESTRASNTLRNEILPRTAAKAMPSDSWPCWHGRTSRRTAQTTQTQLWPSKT